MMRWVINWAARRIELQTADGTILAAYVHPGGSRDGLPADVRSATPPADLAQQLDAAFAGNSQAQAQVQGLLAQRNQQLEGEVRDFTQGRGGGSTVTLGQTPQQGAAANRQTAATIETAYNAQSLALEEAREKARWLAAGFGPAPFRPVVNPLVATAPPGSAPGVVDPDQMDVRTGQFQNTAAAALAARKLELERVKGLFEDKKAWTDYAGSQQDLHQLQAELDWEESQASADPTQDRNLVPRMDGTWVHRANSGLADKVQGLRRALDQYDQTHFPQQWQAQKKEKLRTTPMPDAARRSWFPEEWNDDGTPKTLGATMFASSLPPPLPPLAIRFDDGGNVPYVGDAQTAYLPNKATTDSWNKVMSRRQARAQQIQEALTAIADQKAAMDQEFQQAMQQMDSQKIELQQQYQQIMEQARQRQSVIRQQAATAVAQNPFIQNASQMAGAKFPAPY